MIKKKGEEKQEEESFWTLSVHSKQRTEPGAALAVLKKQK